MIKTDLKRRVAEYLSTLSGKTDKTIASYEQGLDTLQIFFEQYYEGDGRGKTVCDIVPLDIDHILGYFVIRKFMAGVTFRLKTAKAIKAFFKYLADINECDPKVAAVIGNIADHYRHAYPRIEKLESQLWQDTEGEIDEIMKLPKNQQTAEIERLKLAMEGAEMLEAGYVTVEKIVGDVVYGSLMGAPKEKIGPLKLSPESMQLLEVGDIINMITLQKLKNDTFWQIAELGYVYPKQWAITGTMTSND